MEQKEIAGRCILCQRSSLPTSWQGHPACVIPIDGIQRPGRTKRCLTKFANCKAQVHVALDGQPDEFEVMIQAELIDGFHNSEPAGLI